MIKKHLLRLISRLNLPETLFSKKEFLYALVSLVVLIPSFYLVLAPKKVSAYEVSVDGKSVGTFVLNSDQVASCSGKPEIMLTSKKVTLSKTSPVSKLFEVLNSRLTVSIPPTAFELKVQGYSGKRLVFSSQEEVDKLFQLFKEKYIAKKSYDDEKINDVKLKNDYTVEPLYETTPAISVDEALKIVMVGTDEKKTYKLQPGDNVTSVAKKFSLSISDVTKANPQIAGRESKLQIGEELSLIVPKPLLTAEVYKTAVYNESIPFEVKVTNTDQEYRTYVNIDVKGEEGTAKVRANIVEENGVINTSRTEVLQRDVLKTPKTQEETHGTSAVPPKKALGTFVNPVSSPSISSGFGSRGDEYHVGVDIPKSTGTPVYAADGGAIAEVCYDRYASTGLMIRIDHENGYQTRYMHLSEISVKPGERVYQGQRIGSVGSTGNSTGPHLHFELIKNGVNINPATVLR